MPTLNIGRIFTFLARFKVSKASINSAALFWLFCIILWSLKKFEIFKNFLFLWAMKKTLKFNWAYKCEKSENLTLLNTWNIHASRTLTWGVTTDSGSSGGSVRHPGRLGVLRSGRNRSELNPKMQILSFVLNSQLGINTVGYPYLHHVTPNSKCDPTEHPKSSFPKITDFSKKLPKIFIFANVVFSVISENRRFFFKFWFEIFKNSIQRMTGKYHFS